MGKLFSTIETKEKTTLRELIPHDLPFSVRDRISLFDIYREEQRKIISRGDILSFLERWGALIFFPSPAPKEENLDLDEVFRHFLLAHDPNFHISESELESKWQEIDFNTAATIIAPPLFLFSQLNMNEGNIPFNAALSQMVEMLCSRNE